MRPHTLRKTIVSISLVMPLVFAITGCNGLPSTNSATTTKSTPQTYFAPVVPQPNTGSTVTAGSATVNGGATSQPATYQIDDTQDCSANGFACFSQTTTSFTGAQQGTVVNNSGTLTIYPPRGLRALVTTHALPYGGGGTAGTTSPPPLGGSYAVELAGQAGGLVQLLGQPATPLVATANCPTFGAAQTFQFITLPGFLVNSSQGVPDPLTWDPLRETAYGKVTVSASGDTFSNIQQFTLPVNGATGAPAVPPPSVLPKGVCSPTPYGNLMSVPPTVTVTNPGNNQTATLAAAVGIGPSNLLVEWNGNSHDAGNDPSTHLRYNNLLGAGTGAIGLPQPSQALGSGPVAGAASPEYLGFIYGTGNYTANPSNPGATSNLISFGFPAAMQPSCAAFMAQTGALVNGIYGGDFPINNNVVQGVSGIPDPTPANANNPNYPYGNCNLAIDLGAESGTSNGLYPAAKVWIGSYPGTGRQIKSYSFPAVAISGQMKGKYAIFVIGLDTTISPNQAWSIYLLQSN